MRGHIYKTIIALSLVLLTVTGFCGAPFLNKSPSLSAPNEVSADSAPILPSVESLPGLPEPNAFSGNDFLISYDDDNDAVHPALAVTPEGSLDKNWDGSIHSVWEEVNESDLNDPHLKEIHYSMSLGASGGREWSNDEPSEGDRIISNTRKGKDSAPVEVPLAPTYNPGDAVDPAIAVDMFGFIHVVWRELETDGYWEIQYARSEDNGKSWTGFDQIRNIYVSNRTSNKIIPSGPSIAVSNDRDSWKTILHVAWPQSVENFNEIYYSRSVDNGDHWSGYTGADYAISDPKTTESATFPTIATSEKNGYFVHAAWVQNDRDTGQDEIFVTTSAGFGFEWPRLEALASFQDKDGLNAASPSIAGSMDFAIITWSQQFKDPAAPNEIFYSFTTDFGGAWSGTKEEVPISWPDDKESAAYPSASMIYDGNACVVWTEKDQNKWGSVEVHMSESKDVTSPGSWTGQKGDIVLSPPTANADGLPANAGNASLAYVIDGSRPKPHVVWDEVNYTKVAGRVNDNWEIDYVPPADFDIPVHLGWNLLSVPQIQEDTDLTVVLGDIGDGTTTWSRALWYDPLSPSAPWKQYYTGWSSSLNDFTALTHRMCVWVYVTNLGQDGMLTSTGVLSDSTSITLRAGWNMVGYPAVDDSSYTVAQLKSATNANAIEGYDSGSTYLTRALADNYVLQKGEGYWIHVPSTTTWTVDW